MIPWKSIENTINAEFMLYFELANTIVLSGDKMYLIINKYTLINVDEFFKNNIFLIYEIDDYDWEFFTIMPYSLETIMNHNITND